jgi:hypothetical protein
LTPLLYAHQRLPFDFFLGTLRLFLAGNKEAIYSKAIDFE